MKAAWPGAVLVRFTRAFTASTAVDTIALDATHASDLPHTQAYVQLSCMHDLYGLLCSTMHSNCRSAGSTQNAGRQLMHATLAHLRMCPCT